VPRLVATVSIGQWRIMDKSLPCPVNKYGLIWSVAGGTQQGQDLSLARSSDFRFAQQTQSSTNSARIRSDMSGPAVHEIFKTQGKEC
jgi:hypothetical protein